MFVSEYVIFYLTMKLFVKSGQSYEKTFVLRLIFIEITSKQYEYSKKRLRYVKNEQKLLESLIDRLDFLTIVVVIVT